MIALTAATTLMFGTVPAFRASRSAPVDALRRRGHGLSVAGRRVLSGGLVAAQIALCVVLVVTAGLFIAALGLYGVTAHSVARRRSELGVRFALGASARSVVYLVLRRLAVLIAVGLVLGIGGS